MKILDLSFNEITDVSFLAEMKCKLLEEIYLNDNRLNDISFLYKYFELILADDVKLKVITLKNNLFKN